MDSKVVLSNTLTVQKSFQGNKPIFEFPLQSYKQDCGKLSLWTCQSGMLVDGCGVDISPRLHLVYTYPPACPVFSKEIR
jgi:hypothetical protein